MNKYSKDTRLKDLLNDPLGYDILSKVLLSVGKDRKLIDNMFIGNLRLKHLIPLVKRPFIETLIKLLNGNANETVDYEVDDHRQWYKEALYYQIYPLSFCDGNHDGFGDIKGIISKLDYLAMIGVDVIWLSPVYVSPLKDNGYDIADYRNISETFGTMADFEELLRQIHQRGMKLIMDIAINHTSSEHFWFKEFLKGNKRYRDYYFHTTAPNNWTTFFNDGAWEYFSEIGEYVYHSFDKTQFDLNFANPSVIEEFVKIFTFWLDKGVDGFRLDVINLIDKSDFADGNELIYRLMGIRGIEKYFYGPHLHDHLRYFNDQVFKKYDAMTVGETPGIGLKCGELLCHPSRNELKMNFNFDILETPGHARFDIYRYDLRYLKRYYTEWMSDYHAHMALFLENHDNPRMIDKIAPEETCKDALSKLLLSVLMVLKGSPFIYQGQELGLCNPKWSDPSELRDVESLNTLRKLKDDKTAFARVAFGSRDNARTPMAFDNSRNYGFSAAEPWIKLNEDAEGHNVAKELADDASVLNYFIALNKLRKEYIDDIVYGPISFLPADDDAWLIQRGKLTIEINLSEKKIRRQITKKVLLSNYLEVNNYLKPYQVLIYR